MRRRAGMGNVAESAGTSFRAMAQSYGQGLTELCREGRARLHVSRVRINTCRLKPMPDHHCQTGYTCTALNTCKFQAQKGCGWTHDIVQTTLSAFRARRQAPAQPQSRQRHLRLLSARQRAQCPPLARPPEPAQRERRSGLTRSTPDIPLDRV